MAVPGDDNPALYQDCVMQLLFGELTPDQPDLGNGGLEEAINCVPYAASYGPWLSEVAYSSSAGAVAYGAVSVFSRGGVATTFVGTRAKLYKESAGAMGDVGATTTYATAADGAWEFAAYGDTFLGVNGVDPLQVWTLDVSSAFVNASASASAPVAKHIAVVRDFVMLGNIGTDTDKVQWSQIDTPLRYTASRTKQSDSQVLPGTGQVQRITGGDFATILTSRSIWRGDYVGSPLVFRFDEMAPGIGCRAPGSVARFQNTTFFLSESGFYKFDGVNAVPIGSERVDRTFLDDLNSSFLYRITSVIDPVQKLYIVSYPSVASTDGTCDKLAIYGWAVNRWTFAEASLEWLFINLSGGYTLEGLDPFGTMDTLAFSLDSSVWLGGAAFLAGIDTGHRITRFTGSALTARFTTGEGQLFEGGRAFINNVAPMVQGDSSTAISVQIGQRDRTIDSITWGAASTMNSIGSCPVRSSARYQRLRMEISGGFDHASGSNIDAVPDGVR
jgi:hypothetical protein